jgi:hypothetical protein
MHPELENLLSIALKDGFLSDREKEILISKAQKLGVDQDEFEMELEGVISSGNFHKQKSGIVQSEENISVAESRSSKKRGIFGFLTRSYSLDDSYLKGLKKLSRFGDELNSSVQPSILKKYLHEGMTNKEIEIAVIDAFNDIFGKFSTNQAYDNALEILKKKPFLNPYKNESELSRYIKDGMTYEEINAAVETAYQKYFSLYGKTDALKLAIPFIKGLGPIDSSLEFVQSNNDKVSKNEMLLMSYFTDNMSIQEIEDACRNAYLNQFGKKSWGGLGSREMTNPDFSIADLFKAKDEE